MVTNSELPRTFSHMARFDVEVVDYRSHAYLPIVDWGCSNRDGRSWTSMKKELHGSSDSSRINKYPDSELAEGLHWSKC